MIDFWVRWWGTPTLLSLIAGLLWALWIFVSAMPSERLASSPTLSPSETRWIRWFGSFARVSGRSIVLEVAPSRHWRTLQVRHERAMRMADTANRARFAVPMSVAMLIGVLGTLQTGLSLICLGPWTAPTGSPWISISLFVMAWTLVPLGVTSVLRYRWWARRRSFEWEFLQSADGILRRYAPSAQPQADDGFDPADDIERIIAERFSRTPLDLPSHARRARRWHARSAPLLRTRPDAGTTDDPIALLNWIELCSKLIVSDWDRGSMLRARTSGAIRQQPPLPSTTGMRVAWSLSVTLVNVVLVSLFLSVDDLPSKLDDVSAALSAPIVVALVTLAPQLIALMAGLGRRFYSERSSVRAR